MKNNDSKYEKLAFPIPQWEHAGMTLRDYFAAHIIVGMLPILIENGWSNDAAAKFAYTMADSMIEEREERKHNNEQTL